MSLLTGALTARRYRVLGDVPEDFRTSFPDLLQIKAFREPIGSWGEEEIEGWVLAQNLLHTDFSRQDRWLFNHYLVASLRVDKKVLPARLFKAHLDERVSQWCQEKGRERAPASVKTEIKELLEEEMYARTLPRVAVYDFCWNLVDNWVIFAHTSDAANDRFRLRFHDTFGIHLAPFSPLDFLAGHTALAHALEIQGLSDLRTRSEIGS